MKITRLATAQKLHASLQGRIPLAALVEWAERAMLQGDFDPKEAAGD